MDDVRHAEFERENRVNVVMSDFFRRGGERGAEGRTQKEFGGEEVMHNNNNNIGTKPWRVSHLSVEIATHELLTNNTIKNII